MILMHSNSIGCTEHCWRGNDAACGHSFKLTGIKSPKVQQSISAYLIISLHVWKAPQLSTVSSCSSVDISSVTLWTWAEHAAGPRRSWLVRGYLNPRFWDGHQKSVPMGWCMGSGCYPAALHRRADLGLKASHFAAKSCISDLLSAGASHALNIFTPGLRDLEGEKHTQNLQYYILWYHYPSHRVGWNYLLNPIDRPASHESSKLLEHTHGSSPQRQNRYKPAWNILKPCWPVLNHVASPFYKWDSSSWIDRKRKAGLSL